MHDEPGFLRTLLENPADDTTRLVYADWLDERDDATSRDKAHFLRLTARMNAPARPKSDDQHLRRLAAKLDTDWLAVVSRLKVENCGSGRAADELVERYQRQFDFVCDRRWDEMTPTADDAVRHCEACKQDVHYCGTIVEAREHARRGHCVAVDLGIIRREGDLSPPLMVLGMPSPEYYEDERKRTAVDRVSRERERRKRNDSAG